MTVRLELDGVKQAAWERLFDAVPDSTLEQSWTYGEAVRAANGYDVTRGLFLDGNAPLALIQVIRAPFLGIGRVSEILRGPLFLPEAGEGEREAVLSLVARTWKRGLLHMPRWLPELPDEPASHTLLRKAGVRQTVTGYSTLVLDLTAEADVLRAGLSGKWRNALVQAEKAGLKVKETRGGEAIERIVEGYEDLKRRRRFTGPSGETARRLHALARRKRDVLAVTVLQGSTPLSGALFLGHGQGSTYYMGWTSIDGRDLNAQNFAMWRGILKLKEDGFGFLDLGGIDTRREPGIARFKIGTGARLHRLAGTWM